MPAYNIHLNSKEATITGQGRYRFPINHHRSNSNTKGMYIMLLSAHIPNAVYPIRSINNSLHVRQGGILYTFTVPEGYYTGTSMAETLQTLLNGTLSDFFVTYDLVRKTLTFENLVQTFSLELSEQTILPHLGFTETTDTVNTLESVYPVQLEGPNYLNVVFNVSMSGHAQGDKPPVARIHLNQQFGSVVFYRAHFPEKLHVEQTNIPYLEITMYDESGNVYPIPLNHTCEFTIRIEDVPA